RLAGTPITNDILRLLGDDAVDAVPQTPEALLALAKRVAPLGGLKLADGALNRAVDTSKTPEETLVETVKLADELKRSALAITLSHQIIDGKPDVQAYAVAARALAHAGQPQDSAAALERGLHDYPGTPLLILTAARLRFERGDLSGARAMLRAPSERTFSLAERK